MSANDTFKQYKKFVNGVTSETSLNRDKFEERIRELEGHALADGSHTGMGYNSFAKMDTAVSGIAGEAGEINDLWKKIKYHGKPWNEENKLKFLSECGDMFWYLSHLMEVLDVTVEEVLEYNVNKLQSRYPGGKFSIERSENRDPMAEVPGDMIETFDIGKGMQPPLTDAEKEYIKIIKISGDPRDSVTIETSKEINLGTGAVDVVTMKTDDDEFMGSSKQN